MPQIEKPARQRFGKQARIQSFLATEADTQQLGVGELQETAGREGADGGFESVEGGFRGSERNLLLENDVNESWEAGLADPERRCAVFFHDVSQMGIAIHQEKHALSKDSFVQDDLRDLHGSQ